MRSGKIKKTTSYIMGIPMNDLDINVPQLVYDRISESDEFELIEVSFDDKNMCPMVTVGYKDEKYVVDLKIEPTKAITSDFVFSHPMPDECIKKMKQSQIGITVSMTFGENIIESHHFQLKLLDCILPEKAAVVDFNTKRILSPVWIKSVAKSEAAPGPNYIFSVNVLTDDDKSSWIFTKGLNRCGFMELEVLRAAESDIDFYASTINIAANKAISENVFPEEMAPFEIATFENGKKLSVTWRYWKGEMEVHPKETLGTGKRRPSEQSMFNGILYIWPVNSKGKKAVRANEITGVSMENILVEVCAEETKRIEKLAAQTIPALIKGMSYGGAKALVKIKISTGEENKFEHIWAEADEIGITEVYCTSIHDSVYSNEVKKGEKISTEVSNITDWVINLRGKRIAPDNAFLIEI